MSIFVGNAWTREWRILKKERRRGSTEQAQTDSYWKKDL